MSRKKVAKCRSDSLVGVKVKNVNSTLLINEEIEIRWKEYFPVFLNKNVNGEMSTNIVSFSVVRQNVYKKKKI